jgi:Ino eighty subunit 1
LGVGRRDIKAFLGHRQPEAATTNGDTPMDDADELDEVYKELLGLGEGEPDEAEAEAETDDGEEELDDMDKTLLGLGADSDSD